MPFTHQLSPLPYAANALEPFIDTQTVVIHHDKHHQTYVDNLNKALSHPDAAGVCNMKIKELLSNLSGVPVSAQTALRNNAGGVFNHIFYWQTIGPQGSVRAPIGNSAKAITAAFGSFGKFQEEFTNAGLTRFGSGWVWLIVNAQKQLSITQTPYQDNPLMEGLVPISTVGLPILCLDVWEHAYYLKYQNRRADYLKAWWNIVNWEAVERYYSSIIHPCDDNGGYDYGH